MKFYYSLLFFILLTACDAPNPDLKKEKTRVVESSSEKSTPTATSKTPSSPTQADMGNLMNAMHGAAEQQPDDAPKDQYGRPYIIGDLGGVPVNLPSSVVLMVEYDDSPGWDTEKLKNYKPSKRDYHSKIISFGFDFRNHDKQLYDLKNSKIRKEYKAEAKSRYSGQHDWVGVSIGEYGTNENFLNDVFKRFFSETGSNISLHPYAATGEKHYGLEYFIVPGVDPETGQPRRLYQGLVEDLFVYRNEQGRVLSLITCSNNNVPEPPCTHYFDFPSFMKIRITLIYGRYNLKHWKEFEKNAIDIVTSFKAK